MSYKTILVHVDGTEASHERARIAAKIAGPRDAHVIGATMTGISRYVMAPMGSAFGTEGASVLPYIEQKALQARRKECEAQLDRFDEQMRTEGIASFERRLVDDEPVGGLSLQARYADLTILTQFDRTQPGAGLDAALPEIVAMNSGRPTFVLPFAWNGRCAFANAVLAWDASVEATRALHYSLPLLKQANRVQLIVFNAEASSDLHGEEPGADIALYLARHGVQVNVVREGTNMDVGSTLISRCVDFDADFVVAGCYGHSRFREVLLGGVSRSLLSSSTIPVFMAH